MLSLDALLGRKRAAPHPKGPGVVDAVIFKHSEGTDQMGLVIDKPGDLVDVEGGRVISPQPTGGEKASPHIAGVYEDSGAIYRIIDINSIIGYFAEGGRSAGPESRGGTF